MCPSLWPWGIFQNLLTGIFVLSKQCISSISVIFQDSASIPDPPSPRTLSPPFLPVLALPPPAPPGSRPHCSWLFPSTKSFPGFYFWAFIPKRPFLREEHSLGQSLPWCFPKGSFTGSQPCLCHHPPTSGPHRPCEKPASASPPYLPWSSIFCLLSDLRGFVFSDILP